MAAEHDDDPPADALRAALAQVSDGVIGLDGAGRVTLMNAAAEALTGWSERAARTHPLAEVFGGALAGERPAAATLAHLLRDASGARPVSLVLRAQGGGERAVDVHASPVGSPSGATSGVMLVLRDVGARHASERALREKQADTERQCRLYEAILDNTPDLAYVFDLDHRFIYINRGLLTMWGRTLDDSLGKTCLELGYEPWHAAMHDREIDYVAATKQEVRGEVPFSGAFGRRVYDYILVPVLGADGEVEAVAGTTRDITMHRLAASDREGLLASERAARAEAERASLVKEEFLAMLSHELRTPLSAIVGWTRILGLKPPTAETLAQGLAVIDRNVRAQTQLIADLLDMSRIMSGKMRIDLERIDPRAAIEAAFDSVRSGADAKGVAIALDFRSGSDAVVGDPDRLQQVIWNLLSNAIKFTPAGGRVRVETASAPASVAITVSDTGQGIRGDFLPHVFERFRQADNSAAREHGGLGLGLAIVKQLVDLHGGTVEVASAGPDQGTTFTVHLPRAAATMLPAAPRRGDGAAMPNLDGLEVLVVDDEPDTRDLVARLIEDCGAHVVAAGSADEALAAITAQCPDVILSDIGMPGRDGYAFMRTVRLQGVTVPAVALTAFARAHDREKALDAGYQAHVAKPVEPLELMATVAALVPARAALHRPPAKPTTGS